MKEIYFTPETIQKTAADWKSKQQVSSRLARPQFQKEKAALLILDMQDYFLDPESHAFVPSAPAIIPGLNQLIRVFYAWDRPVFFSRHLNTKTNAGMMGSWWRDMITRDHPASGISSELDLEKGEFFEKSQYDAFFKSDLDKKLGDFSVEQIVIGGVMTHLCCETTARSGFVRGYQVFFLVDGTATYNQKFHLGTILNLSHGFSVLKLIDDFLKFAEDTNGHN
jgi:isochorismate hydrolase